MDKVDRDAARDQRAVSGPDLADLAEARAARAAALGQRLGRIVDYVKEMFPPAVYVPYGIASFAAVHFGLQALGSGAPVRLTPHSTAGAATVALLLLLLRVYDDLKDAERDLRLGRAGDPRYASRPIVRGRITVEDLDWFRVVILATLVLLNVGLDTLPFLAFLAVLGVTWLSFRWFFYPPMKESLLLTFLTHNPITLVISAYVVAIYVADLGAEASLGISTVVLLVALWLPVAAWEVSRKVRLPEEETESETYSQLFGFWPATLIPAQIVIASAGLLVVVSSIADLGWFFPVLIVVGAAVPIWACLRLNRDPMPAHTRLQPFMEVYGVVANTGLALAIVLSRGVVLG